MPPPIKISVIFFLSLITALDLIAKETWILDKELSTISFEIPVLLANNVKGEFNKIEGIVEIDIEKNVNNKAVFSVDIKSIDMNYEKHKELLFSNIFFNADQFPIALVNTKKFSYNNESVLEIEAELFIKGKTLNVPLMVEIKNLAEELVQIKGELRFSRTAFHIGTGRWSSTAILRDEAYIKTNLFLFKK